MQPKGRVRALPRADKLAERRAKGEVRTNNYVSNEALSKEAVARLPGAPSAPSAHSKSSGKTGQSYVRHLSQLNTPDKLVVETEDDRSIEGEGEPQRAYSKELSPSIEKYHRYK